MSRAVGPVGDGVRGKASVYVLMRHWEVLGGTRRYWVVLRMTG